MNHIILKFIISTESCILTLKCKGYSSFQKHAKIFAHGQLNAKSVVIVNGALIALHVHGPLNIANTATFAKMGQEIV